MMRSDSAKHGIQVELADEDKLDVWRVRYTSFPEGSQLEADLAVLNASLAAGAAPSAPATAAPATAATTGSSSSADTTGTGTGTGSASTDS